MVKTKWRNVADGKMQEFPIGYSPHCCIVCADVIGGEFKDLEEHYKQRHQDAPLPTFPCSYCSKQIKTVVKRNRHERRCKDRPVDEKLL